MTVYGYARVSSVEQDLTLQMQALKAAGCETIRSEKMSGTTTKGRTELALLREFMRKGDTLVVTRIDRLARSIGDLQDIVRSLKENGVALRATEQPIDTSTAAGKAFLDMLGVFAEFETNLRRERQLEGIEQAKSRGVYQGRKPSIDRTKVFELHATGLGPTEIADELNIGRASVYRILNADVIDTDATGVHADAYDVDTSVSAKSFDRHLHVSKQKALDPNYDVLSDPLMDDPSDAFLVSLMEAEIENSQKPKT